MITVGIRNLRNSLSRYLNMVKSGEHIVVTDHNKIIAEIVPASANRESEPKLLEYLSERARTGSLIQATKRTTLDSKRGARHIPQRTADQIYHSTREDRK
ncbi:MAG: type II toxin-antitoxin system prevent-host-death family antitoxin [Spirochaetales bacterium]|jgi:prevent-host-death family protein|nr:type II toxin-antitoxin system prevent-host-death family antitoxin [Spirochaetales bacterium]